VVINDTYNFEYTNWVSYGSGLSAAAKTALNNYGAYAQSTGAVVPYNIEAYATMSNIP
jgi:hypothetical protein